MTADASDRVLGWMSPELRTDTARAMWTVAVLFSLAGIVLAGLNGWQLGVDIWWIKCLGAIFTGTLGLLVVSKRPTNVIGWIILWMAVLDGLGTFGLQYGFYGVVNETALPFSGFIGTVFYGFASGTVFGLTITFFLLLFPDGHLPSRRWLPIGWAAALGILLMGIGLTWQALAAGVRPHIEQLRDDGLVMTGVPEVLSGAGHILVFIVFPFAVASLFVRRRRAGPIVRYQLRWFAYGAAFLFSSIFVPTLVPALDPYWLWYEGAATAFMFVAVGIAILRYRLYEIDRLVSRTLSYAVITGVLVAVYLGLVFVLTSWLPSESELAVAASTLAVAALFNPVRQRVQDWVDRRFNRSSYDAVHTVDAFSLRLREKVDLVGLSGELEVVVGSTMEPRHVSLWLREAELR